MSFRSLKLMTLPRLFMRMAIGDFTGDGILDLAVLAGDGVHLYVGAGDGTFASTLNTYYPPGSPPIQEIAPLQIAGNVAPMLMASHGDGSFSLLSAGQYGFVLSSSVPSVSRIQSIGPFWLFDVNGDGSADVITPEPLTAGLVIRVGTGAGIFATVEQHLRAWDGIFQVAAADFDGDGVTDIAGPDFSETSVYFGRGDGTFRDPVLLTTDDEVNAMVVIDLDHDGHPDIVEYAKTGTLKAFLSRPFGRFNATSPASTGLGPLWSSRGLVAGRFEGFGFDDVVVLDGLSGRALIYRWNSLGWAATGEVDFPSQTDSLYVADVNNDGWPDLIGTAPNGPLTIALGTCSP